MQKIKVLCVDDSALIRNLMTRIIDGCGDMEVVGVAPDPLIARDLIKRRNPDVLTLDVEMPRMNGLDFLERLMRLRPMPVVMVSAQTRAGSEAALRALELGAVDFVAKPEQGLRAGMLDYAGEIAGKIRAAARSQLRLPRPRAPRVTLPARTMPMDTLVAIGASTGGPEAIRQVLERLPANSPAILIAQHMPAGFTRSFALRLDGLCEVCVKEAEDGEVVAAGHAYVAPGGCHLRVARRGAGHIVAVDGSAPVNRHRPSVDVLFESMARQVGRNAIGVVLTGMGRDGAAGLLAMREAGAATLAQDASTSLVFGMPREAIALGAAAEVLTLDAIPSRLLALSSARTRVAAA